jgi:ABC-type glutathione transport system ATPase component
MVMAPLLELDRVEVRYPVRSGVLIDRTVAEVHAVDDVSLTVHEGETLGIVGESGCGKTTLARCIVRLLRPSAGRILFRGHDVTDARGRGLRAMRREVQMVFQDPQASLNPRKRVGRSSAGRSAFAAVRAPGSRRVSASCCPRWGWTLSTPTAFRTSSPAASASASASRAPSRLSPR